MCNFLKRKLFFIFAMPVCFKLLLGRFGSPPTANSSYFRAAGSKMVEESIRAYFRGERNSLAWEYYEGYFPFSHRLSANLILKSHKFHIFVIKRSVLGILHGNLSTNARQLTPKITAFDKSK